MIQRLKKWDLMSEISRCDEFSFGYYNTILLKKKTFLLISFQKFDLFLSPTTAFSAPKINEDLQSEHIRQRMEQAAELTEAELAELIYDYFDKSLQLTPYTQLANLTGQPAISLPTHVTATGLPLGIQLLAARGREDLLFQVGEQFEQEGKFKLPESYR